MMVDESYQAYNFKSFTYGNKCNLIGAGATSLVYKGYCKVIENVCLFLNILILNLITF